MIHGRRKELGKGEYTRNLQGLLHRVHLLRGPHEHRTSYVYGGTVVM